MTRSITFSGGMVLTPDGALEIRDLHIIDGVIVDRAPAECRRVDCTGLTVAPGIVDVHGDAFELELHPRPGVDIAAPIAMGSVDRQLLTNGITTAFHGLTLSWEPGARSLDAGRRFMAALAELRSRLIADHRVQIRWETFAHEALPDIAAWLGVDPVPAIAFNDHTTLTLERIATGQLGKLDHWAARAGVSREAYIAAVEAAAALKDDVPAKIAEVAALASDRDAVMLSHDEKTVGERALNRARGMTVSEFPLAVAVARDAVANGEHTVLGGPNVIRGGSHTGALSAEEAVCERLCTVLASDYYYPSLTHAVERLVGRGVLDFASGWDLVSRNPAAAMKLSDRGQLGVGRRADVVVIDRTGPWRLVHTMAGGRLVSLG